MKYRKLGKTGLEISEIGFGAWGIGGAAGDGPNSYGRTDDRESKKALRRAYDLGVTFFDTADVYGYGHSEELIGEELHDVRDKIVIASKVGSVEHGGPKDIKDFSLDHIKSAIDESLKRLHTDYLDLYQLHSPDFDVIRKDPKIIETLQDLKQQGKIRAFGVSVDNPNDGIPAINEFGFQSVQVNFNMIDQRAIENGLFELAEKEDVGIIARTPLAFGFLAGKIKNLNFDSQDHRSKWPREQLELWAQAPELFAPVREKRDWTALDLALVYCLSHSVVSTVIPGILTVKEAEENAGVSELGLLNENELSAIKQVYEENMFFNRSLLKK